jgi:hypothetical protein
VTRNASSALIRASFFAGGAGLLILVINFVAGRTNESIREINRADDPFNPSAPDVVAETPDFPRRSSA